MKERLKDFYCYAYPNDKLGAEIDPNATFADLAVALMKGKDVYDVFGVGDSVIRERLFDELAKKLGCNYADVYDAWLR